MALNSIAPLHYIQLYGSPIDVFHICRNVSLKINHEKVLWEPKVLWHRSKNMLMFNSENQVELGGSFSSL